MLFIILPWAWVCNLNEELRLVKLCSENAACFGDGELPVWAKVVVFAAAPPTLKLLLEIIEKELSIKMKKGGEVKSSTKQQGKKTKNNKKQQLIEEIKKLQKNG